MIKTKNSVHNHIRKDGFFMKTKRENKRLLSTVFILFTATLLLAILPTDAEAEIYEDTLRLHILANSDSEEDQELKLKIRDKLLLKYGENLRQNKNIGDAVSKIGELLPSIEADVNLWLRELNSKYGASVTLTEEWYDTREYEDFSLPAGQYKSLRVIIGEGDGKNWWCVMYPPLCREIATERAPADDGYINYTKEEITLIRGGKYNVKFKILESISSIFTKNG